MRIVINSNFRFYEKSLPVILPSIPENEHNIELIIGGSPWEYKKEVKGNVNYHFVNYDNTVFTSLLCINDHPEIVEDKFFYFYTHDTSYFGPQFFNKIRASLDSIIKKYSSKEEFEKNATNYRLTSDGASMDIGLYRSDFFLIKQRAIDLLPEKNLDLSEQSMKRQKELAYQNEDNCIKNTESLQTEIRITSIIPNPYGSNVNRIQEYYSGLDFYKYKGNWHYMSREINL
jgi:hypothetical protein